MNENNRKQQRVQLRQSVTAINALTKDMIGEVVNITTDGLMLLCNKPVKSNSLYQLRLNLSRPVDDNELIDIGVDCLWCREAENMQSCWAGFQIIDIPEKSLAILQDLISSYSQAPSPA
ncbi:hypothetical protein SIN8267_03439 [Sinobacterium norvegicum]|uniref:PilZ domain-containing protein n=1 Tax=Sinobacterium norvegicum TaxID=1641715 RepID=A0ABM9AJH1_9GAMM|nr:PilZ domain-containing protein [Sinobacterium norvegicum]CAH0993291.1 hypothetical protein SIN8267_03439 [Sinobacterium norvegicum]